MKDLGPDMAWDKEDSAFGLVCESLESSDAGEER